MMPIIELDGLLDRLISQVLEDRDLGDGRTFTRLHFSRLWALTCLQAGECFDEQLLADRVPNHLPSFVAFETGARARDVVGA